MDAINEEILGHSIISPKLITTYLDKISKTKQWVAEIKGIDKTFGFSREFIKQFKNDYRPDFHICYYELRPGKIYEYNNLYVGQGKYVCGYFATLENGTEILPLEKEQIRRLLGMPSKNWVLKKEIIKPAEKYVDDDVPF